MSARTRLGLLADAIRREGGQWTTQRVQRLYSRAGHDAPFRATARGDLKTLARRGVLTLHEDRNRRYFTLANRAAP